MKVGDTQVRTRTFNFCLTSLLLHSYSRMVCIPTKRTLEDNWKKFLHTQIPCLSPNQHCQALKETQSIDLIRHTVIYTKMCQGTLYNVCVLPHDWQCAAQEMLEMKTAFYYYPYNLRCI